jgi:hypothetical protein
MPLEQRRADPLGAASAPKQQAIPSEMMEGLYAGAEDWSHLFPDEVNDRLNAQLSGTPDPVRARMAIANNALLSDRLNLTPAEVMERSTDLRDFYGREVLKLDGDGSRVILTKCGRTRTGTKTSWTWSAKDSVRLGTRSKILQIGMIQKCNKSLPSSKAMRRV